MEEKFVWSSETFLITSKGPCSSIIPFTLPVRQKRIVRRPFVGGGVTHLCAIWISIRQPQENFIFFYCSLWLSTIYNAHLLTWESVGSQTISRQIFSHFWSFESNFSEEAVSFNSFSCLYLGIFLKIIQFSRQFSLTLSRKEFKEPLFFQQPKSISKKFWEFQAKYFIIRCTAKIIELVP